MRPLIIDYLVREKLAKLLLHAGSNIFSKEDLQEIRDGKMPPPGDRKGFSVELDFGYRVVFSIAGLPSGAYRHLSVSIPAPGKLPAAHAVNEIMNLLGFRESITKSIVSRNTQTPY